MYLAVPALWPLVCIAVSLHQNFVEHMRYEIILLYTTENIHWKTSDFALITSKVLIPAIKGQVSNLVNFLSLSLAPR